MTAEEILDRDMTRIRARRAQKETLEAAPPESERQYPKEAIEAWDQLERHRIAAGEPEDPSGTVEAYAVQRRWFAAQRQLATQRVLMQGRFPNERDFQSQVEMNYLTYAAVAFSTSNMQFEGANIQTVDELVNFAHEWQDGNGTRDKLIDRLRDQISDLEHDLFQAKGKEN